MSPERNGILFVISAPSGAGKTTLCAMAVREIDNISLSISHTTRSPRPGEQDGVNYYFTDEATFLQMVDSGLFLEWARVHGNLYGTSKDRILQSIQAGKDVILDIDVQGGFQIKGHFPDSVLVFILPPSMQVLRERLINRKTDADDTIAKRLQKAQDEIKELIRYDYVIVNNQLQEAFAELHAIIKAERLKVSRKHKSWFSKIL